jgi:hypothetical protein
LDLVDQFLFNEKRPQSATIGLLLFQNLVQLLASDDSGIDEQFSESKAGGFHHVPGLRNPRKGSQLLEKEWAGSDVILFLRL